MAITHSIRVAYQFLTLDDKELTARFRDLEDQGEAAGETGIELAKAAKNLKACVETLDMAMARVSVAYARLTVEDLQAA